MQAYKLVLADRKDRRRHAGNYPRMKHEPTPPRKLELSELRR